MSYAALIRHTRVYREAFEEGRQEERQKVQQKQIAKLIVRLLKKKFGQEVCEETRARLESLSLETLQDLGEALLDFTSLTDLQPWLDARAI